MTSLLQPGLERRQAVAAADVVLIVHQGSQMHPGPPCPGVNPVVQAARLPSFAGGPPAPRLWSCAFFGRRGWLPSLIRHSPANFLFRVGLFQVLPFVVLLFAACNRQLDLGPA